MIFAEYFPPVSPVNPLLRMTNINHISQSQRGTATGFFLAGVVLGSPLGKLSCRAASSAGLVWSTDIQFYHVSQARWLEQLS